MRTVHVARRGRQALAVTASGLVAVLLGSGIASADTAVDNYLNWSGIVPILGRTGPITAELTADLPSTAVHGTAQASVSADLRVTLPPLAVDTFEVLFNAAYIEGTDQVTLTVTDSAGQQYTTTATMTVPLTALPPRDPNLTPPYPPISYTATGDIQLPAVAHAGTATIQISGLGMTVVDLRADGTTPAAFGQFPVANIELAPPGPTQNPTDDPALATMSIQ